MKHPKLNALALGAALALACSGHALAESQYGYSTTGADTVTATASVKLKVVIPKLVLLKVGSSNGVQDTVSWAAKLTIPPSPGFSPTADANDTVLAWDGAAPTVQAIPTGNNVTVAAWTNATTANINCTMGTWVGTGGPANGDFEVTSTGSLPHPGGNLGACASTTIGSNTLLTGTWEYALTGGTPTSWKAGTYTNTVVYTATGV